MPPKTYSLFHSSMQKIASTRPGAWFYSRTLHYFDRFVLRLSGGRSTLTGIVTGLPVLFLTTTGAKSGLPRTLPLLFIRDPNNSASFALIASNWGQEHYPAWYFNLKANPNAACSINGQTKKYVAHEAGGDEYEQFWQAATNTYLGYSLYKQRVGEKRRIPIMVLTPL